MDGFGSFNYEVGPSDNSNAARLTSYSFTLQFQAGKYDEATAQNFIVGNSGAGNYPGTFDFALEYFPTSGNTGFGGVPNVVTTPAPPGLVLGGVGIFCLLVWATWRRRKLTVLPA
jgi:hypothetical protein